MLGVSAERFRTWRRDRERSRRPPQRGTPPAAAAPTGVRGSRVGGERRERGSERGGRWRGRWRRPGPGGCGGEEWEHRGVVAACVASLSRRALQANASSGSRSRAPCERRCGAATTTRRTAVVWCPSCGGVVGFRPRATRASCAISLVGSPCGRPLACVPRIPTFLLCSAPREPAWVTSSSRRCVSRRFSVRSDALAHELWLSRQSRARARGLPRTTAEKTDVGKV